METFYLIVVIVLFILAISDLVVGVSNDAVNFLNSAVGAKAGSFKLILAIAALGILVGCTFSSGMMEVARKGIFHPEHFYFSEIILLFLAVMVTDIILLDTFNTFGMPTSTTVSIVFELLGAAVAFSLIKIYTSPDALTMGEYINSAKALAIISGILLSVVVAFTAGAIVQYLTRLLFSFNYEKSLKYFGALWGGLAIAAITYFMLIKGAKGASFMDDTMKDAINNNALLIIAGSFVVWALILQLTHWLFKFDILKFIVMIGTFALAMAFAGNDLVNFIGVPLAGYNSYELYMASDGIAPNAMLMDGLAGKIKTPTLLLVLAGAIMAITLWTSKKARSVIKTSLDLGRQYEGSERFTANTVSRSLVRNFSKMAMFVNKLYPKRISNYVDSRFDERPFVEKQMKLGTEAPSFDMIRASSTLVVASILIAIGTSLKLPLSTTYVTFMVFMGTSLADGAWGRESAVYRVSGVMSVVGGWFFTAFSAFTVAFIIANIFHFGGSIAIIAVILLTGIIIYRTHKYHDQRTQEQIEFELSLEEGHLKKGQILELSAKFLKKYLGGIMQNIDRTLDGLEGEKLKLLSKTNRDSKNLLSKSYKLRSKANNALDKIDDEDIDTAHLFILCVDYINEMVDSADHIVRPSFIHVDNNHKTLLKSQFDELREVQAVLNKKLQSTIDLYDPAILIDSTQLLESMEEFLEMVRVIRKKQIKRIKAREIGTKNSLLFLNHLAELRNLGWFSSRLIIMYKDLVIATNAKTNEDDAN